MTFTLDIGLSYISVFLLQFAKLTTGHFFPVLPLLSSSVCKLYKANNCSFCLYSLSLSLLEPSIQCETDALRLQWRGKKLRSKTFVCFSDVGKGSFCSELHGSQLPEPEYNRLRICTIIERQEG